MYGISRAVRLALTAIEPIPLVATRQDEVIGHVTLSACRLDAPLRLFYECEA